MFNLSNKGVIQGWLILVVVLLVIVIGVLLWQSQKTEKEVIPPAGEEEVIPPAGEEEEQEEQKTEEQKEEVKEEGEFADWKTYRNEEYGFEVKYPANFNISDNYGEVYLFSTDYTDTKIYISTGKDLSVPLGGTFGGRFQYSENQQPASKVFSEKDSDFTKDYFLAYGGMGSWDIVINAYQHKDENYYIVSLYRGRQLGVPDSGTGNSKEEIIERTLTEMRNKDSEHTRIFNQILSTFEFIE